MNCVQQLKVLADEKRLAILVLLLEGSLQVGEMNAVLGLEQSLLSHHLKALRDAGFVRAVREGKAVRYCLAPGCQPLDGTQGIDLGCCLLSFH